MFKTAIGQSKEMLLELAMREVLEQINSQLGDTPPQAGILFCPVDSNYDYILSSIQTAFPFIELIGCTSGGEITSAGGFAEDSIVLIVFASDNVEIKAGAAKSKSSNGRRVGQAAALAAKTKLQRCRGDERFAIILTDPMIAGLPNVDKGLAQALGENFPVYGAASAAHSKGRATFQFYNDEIFTSGIVMLLFAGKVVSSSGIEGGHTALSGKEMVTSSEKNVIYRISGQPALDFFRSYIGEDYSLFLNYCLAVFEPDSDLFFIRSVPLCNPKDGSITLNGYVPEGSLVQIVTADKRTCVSSCGNSARMALRDYPGEKPSAALLFSCAGRKMMMGPEVVREAETVEELLRGTPYCGFYAYGEIGPLQRGGKPQLHGTTFVTLLLGPEE